MQTKDPIKYGMISLPWMAVPNSIIESANSALAEALSDPSTTLVFVEDKHLVGCLGELNGFIPLELMCKNGLMGVINHAAFFPYNFSIICSPTFGFSDSLYLKIDGSTWSYEDHVLEEIKRDLVRHALSYSKW